LYVALSDFDIVRLVSQVLLTHFLPSNVHNPAASLLLFDVALNGFHHSRELRIEIIFVEICT